MFKILCELHYGNVSDECGGSLLLDFMPPQAGMPVVHCSIDIPVCAPGQFHPERRTGMSVLRSLSPSVFSITPAKRVVKIAPIAHFRPQKDFPVSETPSLLHMPRKKPCWVLLFCPTLFRTLSNCRRPS